MTEEIDHNHPLTNSQWDEVYAKQRKDRLCDVVHDYLHDNQISPLTFYNDLCDVIRELRDYHRQNLEDMECALHLINGDGKQEVSGIDGDVISSEVEHPQGLTKRWIIG